MDLAQYDVIVPIWSFGIQHPAALQAVLAAVAQGVGLATFHGGIDWFADRDYARMIGGHFVFHPPSNRYDGRDRRPHAIRSRRAWPISRWRQSSIISTSIPATTC